MEFKDVLAMYFERGMALQTFWNFYVTIVIGYLAFLGVLAPSPRNKRVSALLTIGFLVFATVNLGGLVGVSRQRSELQSLLMEPGVLKSESYPPPAKLKEMRETFNAPSVKGVVSLHLLGDALLLGFIWLIPAISRSEKTRGMERANVAPPSR